MITWYNANPLLKPFINRVDDIRKGCRGFKASGSGETTHKIWSEMCRKIFFVYMFVACFMERKQWKQASCSRLTICCMNTLCTIKGFECPSHMCECLLRDFQLFLFESSSWGWALCNWWAMLETWGLPLSRFFGLCKTNAQCGGFAFCSYSIF